MKQNNNRGIRIIEGTTYNQDYNIDVNGYTLTHHALIYTLKTGKLAQYFISSHTQIWHGVRGALLVYRTFCC